MPEVSAPSASADGEMKIQAAKEKDTAAAAQEGGSSTSSPSTAGTHSSSPNGLDEQGPSKSSAATSQSHVDRHSVPSPGLPSSPADPPHLTGGGTAAQIASMAFAHDLSPVEEAPALELTASPTPATPSNGTFGSVSFEAPDTSAHLEQLDLGLESEPPVCNSAPKCISPPPAGTEPVAPRPPSPAFAQGGAEEGAEEGDHKAALRRREHRYRPG